MSAKSVFVDLYCQRKVETRASRTEAEATDTCEEVNYFRFGHNFYFGNFGPQYCTMKR